MSILKEATRNNYKTEYMEERKFNIGDRVVCIDKQYYDNIYHNGLNNRNENHFIRSSIVSDVYDYKSSPRNKVFYVDNYHHQVDAWGDSCTDQYGEIREKDGTYTMGRSDRIWYHAEKDADEIKRVIDECKKDFHKKCEESRQKEINKLEDEIRYAQNRINEFKKGDKFMYCGWTKSENEWNDSMDKIINNIIGKK